MKEMDRRNILKAAIVAPFVGLGVKKAAAEQTNKVPWTYINTQIGYIRFKDTQHMIVVDREYEDYVESIRMILAELLGICVNTHQDTHQLGIMRLYCDLSLPTGKNIGGGTSTYGMQAMGNCEFLCVFDWDEYEYKPNERRSIAEKRIEVVLNNLQQYFATCAVVAKRLNLNK